MSAKHDHDVVGDRIGQILSLLCVAHCVLTPFVLGLMPAASALFGSAHPILFVAVAGTALWAFVPSYRHHKNIWVPALGAAGIACLGVAALFFADHRALDVSFSIVGAGLMLGAHWKNQQLQRACNATLAQ